MGEEEGEGEWEVWEKKRGRGRVGGREGSHLHRPEGSGNGR